MELLAPQGGRLTLNFPVLERVDTQMVNALRMTVFLACCWLGDCCAESRHDDLPVGLVSESATMIDQSHIIEPC